MAERDYDIKIKLATSYDGAGEQAAAEGLQEVRRAAAEAAAAGDSAQQSVAATEKRSRASEQSAAALERERAEMEAIQAQMELEAKGREGLIQELNRLNAARSAAAKAGDVEAFRTLDAQVQQVRSAYEKMNQSLEVAKIGMMGQMQLALQVGGTLQSFGDSCRNGTASVMGLANATLALGTAIKAGMGPLGWVMLAIQGLTMAWDWYSASQEEAAEAERERLEANNEALARHMEQVQKLAALSRENMLTAARAELEGISERFDKLTAQQEQAARRTEQREAAAEQRRRAAAQAVFEAEKARVELARTLGQITEAEATTRLNAAEDALAAELAAVEELEKKRTNAAAIEAKRRAEKEAAELAAAIEQKFAGTDSLLKLELPSAKEWEALQIKYTEGLTDAAENAAETRIRGELVKLRRLMESMGIAFEGGDEELLRWLDDLRAARKEADKMVEAAREEAESAGAAAELSKLELETKQQEAAAEAVAREARRKQQEAAERNKQLELEWQEVERRELAEQVKWLEATTANFAAGSEAAEKWARQLEAAQLRQVQEELSGLETSYKVTGSYAAKEARTAAEIYEADRAALAARRTALEQLQQQPGLDAATQKNINDKLAETRKQLSGLEEAAEASAAAARATLAGLAPMGQTARNGGGAAALKRAEAAFAALARRAEQQASAGDEKGLERTLGQMRRAALAQEQLTGYTGRAAEAMKKVEAATQEVLRGTAEEDRGLTAQQRRQNEILEALGQKRRWHARAAKAAEGESRAAEKERRAQERAAEAKAQAAQAAAKDGAAAREQAVGGAAAVAALEQQVAAANAALAAQAAQLERLGEALAQLVKLAAAGQAAAGSCAGTAAAGVSALRGAVAGLRREMEELRRAVAMAKRL